MKRLLTLIAILVFTATINAQPTLNLFTGGHTFHGQLEFNSARGLAKTTETLVNQAE